MFGNILILFYFIIIIVSGVISFDTIESTEEYEESLIDIYEENTWDVLIFTQQWPVTACFSWMEKSRANKCDMPNENEKELWTIHGIWPTKYGTIGPLFCNRSASFDIKMLDSIRSDLNLYWPEVEVHDEMESLWKHEWLKHGTCAVQIPQFNDELKYFKKGLEWRSKYLISNMLDSVGIHPNSENTVIHIHNALRKYLNHNPSIHCYYDHKNDISYLSEIRICFNKTLDLIDCDGISTEQFEIDYPRGNVITNCYITKPIKYPSTVPPVETNSWKFPFVNFYKLLNFIMWSTL